MTTRREAFFALLQKNMLDRKRSAIRDELRAAGWTFYGPAEFCRRWSERGPNPLGDSYNEAVEWEGWRMERVLGIAAEALLTVNIGEGFAKDAGASAWNAAKRLREVVAGTFHEGAESSGAATILVATSTERIRR
ncbi:hypothetical protein [Nocardia africana]